MEVINLVFLVSIAAALFLSAAEAHPNFRSEIPNGKRVYDPCHPGTLVRGVGHVNIYGNGKRNSFGEDFAEQEFEWTEELCKTDSDKDGLTNGAELGDPYCIWKPGDTPTRTTNITSPGISNRC
ncbi:hypothetical protein BsWGS_10985 [Bradybaena similaris]